MQRFVVVGINYILDVISTAQINICWKHKVADQTCGKENIKLKIYLTNNKQ
jgi:hypothetical protein